MVFYKEMCLDYYLLFIIIINDTDLYVDCDFTNLFADNTSLICKGEILNEVRDFMIIVLSRITKGLTSNKLIINVSTLHNLNLAISNVN